MFKYAYGREGSKRCISLQAYHLNYVMFVWNYQLVAQLLITLKGNFKKQYVLIVLFSLLCSVSV